ncbi:MAG: acetate--CoA ligase family protein [Hydrogenophaga sp.]|nr:acetate--CoA ligase family protein [Hydrogenophaga sp.]
MSGQVSEAAAGPELCRLMLRPRSIALVGASDDPNKTTGRPLRFLRAAGATARIYPVNPSRTEVQGEPAWPSLSALPEVPDHVFVLSGTDSVLVVAREAAMLGVRLITVLASGYSEAGEDGARREAELARLCRDAGMRLLGPNSLGLVRPSSGLYLTANAAFAEPGLPSGGVFMASQSGSLLGALVSRGKSRGVGFAGLVSVGSESDLSVGEICEAVLDEPDIDVFLLFLENLRHADALQRFARAAASRGKAVLAYKLGRSEAAAEMAASHTGALSGEDVVADAFLRGLGVARLGVMESMLEAPALARAWPVRQRHIEKSRRPAPRVGVVTTTGGGSAMVVDQLSLRGVDVCPPAPETLQRLRDAGLNANGARVLDLTLAGTRYEVMKAALDILTDAPEFDLVLAVIGSSARFQPELAVKPAIDVWSQGGRVAVMVVPEAPQALLALTEVGIPNFRTPESCADSISAALGRRVPGAPAAAPVAVSGRRALDEFQAYELLEQLDLPHAACVLAGLDGPVNAPPFAGPYVVKACSSELLHKTDAGGVVVGVKQESDLPDAVRQIRRNLDERAPHVRLQQVLVQQMVAGAVCEVLLGYRVDATVGPMVMLAAGGILAEALQDRSLRMAPVDLQTALEMIDEVRLLRVLDGLRGQAAGDRLALAHALVNLSQCALRPELGVVEAEVNPLFVMPQGQGVVAVDALVICTDQSVLTDI